MWLDAHQHFWRYDANEYGWIDDRMAVLKRDFTADDLAPHLAEHSISGTVAVQAQHSLSETEALLAIADEHPFVRGVVGWVDLCSSDAAAQLERFVDHPRFVGVRHIVQDEPDERFLLRDDFVRGVRLLEPLGLTYDVLVFPRQLPAAVELVAKLPNQRFVLDHIAKPPIAAGAMDGWEADLRRLAGHENVSCKVSGMVTEARWESWSPKDFEPYLDAVFDSFGTERLMFGSDWPVCTLAAPYQSVVDIVRGYLEQGSEDEREAVMGDNAIAFYGLAG
jgi:L-fuconolactonase